MKKKKLRGYIFSRSFMNERAPQHVQNIVIRDYCEKNNFLYLLSSVEYAMKNCHLMLQQTLNEIKHKKLWNHAVTKSAFNPMGLETFKPKGTKVLYLFI